MSASVEIRVIEILSGQRNLCATEQFVLVAVDNDGHPVPVSSVESSDPVRVGARDVGSPRSPGGGDG